MEKHGRNRERRWLVLGEDGRHVWLGRNSDPSDDEIRAAEAAPNAQSLSGWLAVSEGDYWSRRESLTLLLVRPLAKPAGDFREAAAAFEHLRVQRLKEAVG